MKAEEIIPATHRLEQSGMTRNEAEAVISELQKVVAPLATKDDLAKLGESIRSDMGTMEESIRSDMGKMEESIRSDMGTMGESIRSNMESMRKSMATKVELAKMETRLFLKLSGAMLGVGALVVSILGFLF